LLRIKIVKRNYAFGATTAFCAGLSEINYGHHHHPAQSVLRECNSVNGRLVHHQEVGGGSTRSLRPGGIVLPLKHRAAGSLVRQKSSL